MKMKLVDFYGLYVIINAGDPQMKIAIAGLEWETPREINKLLEGLSPDEKAEFEAYTKKILGKTAPMLLATVRVFFARNKAMKGLKRP